MKKFWTILIALVLVLASALTLVACNGTNGKDEKKFSEVDTNDAEQVTALSDTLSKNVLANVHINRAWGEPDVEWYGAHYLDQMSFSKFNANLQFDTNGIKRYVGVNLEVVNNGKIQHGNIGNSFKSKVLSDISLSGGITLPEELLDQTVAAEQAESMLTALNHFSLGAEVYCDGSNVYVNCKDSVTNWLKQLNIDITDNKFYYQPETTSDSLDDGWLKLHRLNDTEREEKVKADVDEFLENCKNYKLDVAVSEENGWYLRVTATEQTITALLDDPTLGAENPEVFQLVKKALSVKKFKVEFTLGFDSEGNFAEIGFNTDLDITLNLGADDVPDMPFKMTLNMSSSSSDSLKIKEGEVTVPENLDSYKDVSEVFAQPEVTEP